MTPGVLDRSATRAVASHHSRHLDPTTEIVFHLQDRRFKSLQVGYSLSKNLSRINLLKKILMKLSILRSCLRHVCKMRGCTRLTNRFGEEGSRAGKRGVGGSNRPSFRRKLDGGASSESRSPRVRSRSLRCGVLLRRGEFAGDFWFFA